jgi:dTDP-glucose pyrophosphorylase
MIVITDFSNYACSPDTPIRDVLARINSASHLFQIAIDDRGRLCGTITDGDIRRAMLHGIGLDDPARKCMQSKPVVGLAGARSKNFERLRHTGSSRSFLPVLDTDNRVVEIIVATADSARVKQALIMAGGFGRRLGARTEGTPKPLLPIGGKPILEHLLKRLEDSGVAKIFISVHYCADQIKSYVASRKNCAEIDYIDESVPLGTAGAVGRLVPPPTGPIMIVNGDVLTKVDVSALHDFHVRHDLDATIGVARYDVDVPFGVVKYGEDGLFAGIEEKPSISNFIAAGIYYLSPEFVALVPSDRPIDMPELLNLGRRIGLKIGVFPIHEYWTDIGRPDDFDRAEKWYRSRDAAT